MARCGAMRVPNVLTIPLAIIAFTASATPGHGGAQQPLPTPESVLGFPVGADFRLASYDEALEYFRHLDAATDRLELLEVGRTTGGLPWYVALISAPENLAELERYRAIAQRLAHPRGLTDEEARRLAREGRAIVHIDGGLHSTEVAHAQHTIQLAYDLVSGAETDPKIAAILEQVILVLWFSINPDGQNLVVEWYEGNLGTPFEVAPLPRLYQAYIGHDNNRDGYMLNMVESRVVAWVTRHFEPQIFYNHHQSSPFPTRIWIPPFAEPVSPHVHPLMWRTINQIGMNMARALEERGQVGATHMGTGFDNWYPGFIDHANNFHNVVSFLTETALYRYATPHFYTLEDFPKERKELRPESLYASPWKGGWWRLRDAVEYMLTASMSVLEFAAKYREELLYNRYQAGRDVIRQHRQEPPTAYFIPERQRDPVAAVELLRRLAFNGVEIYRLGRRVTFENRTFPAGTWVIPMDQEFALYVRQLFAVQEYPEIREFPEGPPDQPFDVTGWTLPYQMDVRVVEATSPLPEEVRGALEQVGAGAAEGAGRAPGAAGESPAPEGAAALPPYHPGGQGAAFDSVPGIGFDAHPVAAAILPPPGRIRGSGPAVALDPAQNNAFRVINRAWAAGGTVRFVAGGAGAAGEPAGAAGGRYLITGVPQVSVEEWVESLALQAERTRPAGRVLRRPRIGLYRPWRPSIDEGWTRWLLEQYGFEATTLRNADFRNGGLGERFDVILLADYGPRTVLEGFPTGSVPARYAGGIGREGVRALDEFVRRGGTLVCLNRSSDFAVEELHLPVKDVVKDLERREFYVRGSILAVTVDPAHPVMAGMPAEAKVFVDLSPVFTTTEGFEGAALARYPERGSPLLSGYLLGEERLRGYAAALHVRHGDGHVVLIGFRPQWRGQSFGTFRVLFNAVLFHGEVAAAARGTPGFWEPPPPEEGEEEAPAAPGEPGERAAGRAGRGRR